jgi:hypothetical protein
MRMVEEGVASAADIDKALELGYRHPMGPLRLTDLVGLDVRLDIARYLHEKLGAEHFPAAGDPRADGRRGQTRQEERPRLLRLDGDTRHPPRGTDGETLLLTSSRRTASPRSPSTGRTSATR